MADEAITRALADCLEALREGARPLDERLSRYPALRAELEELLRVVEIIPTLPISLEPDPRFVERTRRRITAGSDESGSPGLTNWDPSLA